MTNLRIMYQKAIIASLCLLFSVTSYATIITGPDYTPDVGDEIFTNVGSNNFVVEIFDFSELDPNFAYEFGLYFASDNSSRVTIFDSADLSTASLQSAIIDFDTGVVLDFDSSAIQSSFLANGPFGYYLEAKDLINNISTTFFTQAALNPGSIDFSETLKSTTAPLTYLIGFEIGDSSTNGTLLFLSSVFGIEPVANQVSSPSILMLVMLSGISLLIRRKALS